MRAGKLLWIIAAVVLVCLWIVLAPRDPRPAVLSLSDPSATVTHTPTLSPHQGEERTRAPRY